MKGENIMFKSLVVDRKDSRGTLNRTGRECKNSLGYARYKHKGGKQGDQVSFLIGHILMKKARLIIGDRMDVLYDEESKLGLLKRVTGENIGNKISKAQSKSYGKLHVAASLGPFPVVDGIVNLENVTVDDQGILFAWPEESKK